MNNPSTCPHFSFCSGCEIADFLNPPIWKEALAFFHQQKIDPIFISDGFSQTRFKAKLAVRSGPEIGLFKRKTHEVISIPHCLVHHGSINRAVAIIKEEIEHHNIAPYREHPPAGTLRYIQLFVERSTGKVQLTLVLTNSASSSFYESLLKHDLWHSVWLNFQPAPNNRVLGDIWEHLSGEPFLWQTINNTPVAFHPGAFSQTHLPLFEKMVQQIQSWVTSGDQILELYAGVGAIGLSLSHPHITLVENNPFAHLSFLQSKTEIPYHCIDAKEAPLDGYNTLIVDPPRKGLDPILLNKICAHEGKLIYVSCGFESFKRDCEQLFLHGWKLKEAFGYLLFPGTNHVEILSLLTK